MIWVKETKNYEHRRNDTILCVCYTNHTLDQFQEHLLEAREMQLVCIGGWCKSSTVEPYQLNALICNNGGHGDDPSKQIKQLDAVYFKENEAIEKYAETVRAGVG